MKYKDRIASRVELCILHFGKLLLHETSEEKFSFRGVKSQKDWYSHIS